MTGRQNFVIIGPDGYHSVDSDENTYVINIDYVVHMKSVIENGTHRCEVYMEDASTLTLDVTKRQFLDMLKKMNSGHHIT